MSNNNHLKILVRLPNWLGDMVMASAFIRALHEMYPGAMVDVIAKKGIDALLQFMPGINQAYIFSKDEYPGLKGAYQFGRIAGAGTGIVPQKNIKKTVYDLFFCLPDSFSSALMARATNARQRIGFGKELRNFLLTKTFTRPPGLHRVDEYLNLLQQFTQQTIAAPAVELKSDIKPVSGRIIINLNSEAESRRMPVLKAIAIVEAVRQQTPSELFFIGGPKEKAHVDAIVNGLSFRDNVINLAGQTTLTQLFDTIAGGSVLLSTDSGPAHVGNALGIHTVVLFGAGNEHNTAPYNQLKRTIIRLGQLNCEPCVKNVCKFGAPKCLLMLDEVSIAHAVAAHV